MIVKSIYNRETLHNALDSAKDGQYGITLLIPSKGGKIFTVNGILKEALGFNVDATWSTLGLEGVIDNIMSSNQILAAIDTVFDVSNLASGSSFTNTGIFSKLFYKNSGRLSLSPSFRVFDNTNNGICTRIATILTGLCIPYIDTNQSTSLSVVADLGDDLATAIETGAKSQIAQKLKLGNKANRTALNIREGSAEVGSSDANWSSAPKPIGIQIGNWLTINEVVVTNVGIAFSHECSDKGPLWVDVSLKCDTRENLAYNVQSKKIQQFTLNSSSSRVSISDETQGFESGYGVTNQ